MKRILFFVSMCCACACLFAHEAYTVETIPSPKEKGQEYYVSNPDSVLSEETVKQLNQMLAQLDFNTDVELAVVAIDEFESSQYTTYQFALKLFNHWGIGKADKNTGVLVLLARKARDIQIITGSGIEGILPDAECGQVLDNNLDYLRENDFDQGVIHICQNIVDILMQDDHLAELALGWKPKDSSDDTVLMWPLIIGFLLMALFAKLAYKRLNGKPGETVEDIQEQSEDLQTGLGCLAVMFPIPMLFF